MRRLFILLLCFALLPVPCALCDGAYLIADSNTRRLTEEELWGWSLDALGYVLNEIFARHGYNFHPGGRYDNYFRSKSWYVPNANTNNDQACYPKLSEVEWANERLVKKVMNDMRAQGTVNPGGRGVHDAAEESADAFYGLLSGFRLMEGLTPGQTLNVYSAPSAYAWRGAGGRACVSTSGPVYAAGWDNGWLLVMYETDAHLTRVGYVSSNAIRGAVEGCGLLDFEYSLQSVSARVALTDDPASCSSLIYTLEPGQRVSYLTSYFNERAWDYVQVTVNGQPARGFIPSGFLN